MSNARDKANIPALNFSSTGIDDNATSTAITIDSSQNVDVAGTIVSNGLDVFGTNNSELVNISGNSNQSRGLSISTYAVSGQNNTGVRFSAPTASGIYATLTFATNGKDRLNIEPDGDISFYEDTGTTPKFFWDASAERLGIGTSSPASQLHLYSDLAQLRLEMPNSTNSNRIEIKNTTSTFYLGLDNNAGGAFGVPNAGVLWLNSNNPLIFATNNSQRMRIDNSGTFYLNTTSSPTSNSIGTGSIGQLVTSGDGWNMKHTVNGATMVNMWQTGTTGNVAFNFYKGNTQTNVGSINLSTSATSYATSSDYRLKENVDYSFDATTRLKQLKPARFNFIIEPDKTVDGFLAHEVSDIVPEAITGEKDAVDENGNPKYQGIDQSKLVPLLVKTIQELEARITALETTN